MTRALTIAPGTRRRGPPRESFGVPHGSFLWRIAVIVDRLNRLVDIEAGSARTEQTVLDLGALERRVVGMLNEAQVAAIRAALPEGERTACDG